MTAYVPLTGSGLSPRLSKAVLPFLRERRKPLELQRIFRIVFAGGGTGGHLAPGMAIAGELQQRLPCEVTFFTTGKKLEQTMLADTPFRQIDIPCAPPAASPSRAFRFVQRTVRGFAKAFGELRRNRPHAVVALGGYGALPAALAARMLGVPLVVSEQNVIAGRATRFLSRWAKFCITQWPLPEYELHAGCRQVVRGNPVRRAVREGDRHAAISRLGLRPDRRTLLLMGGSQGARALNNWLILNRDTLAGYKDYMQLVVVAGSEGAPVVKRNFARVPNVHVLEFSNRMGDLLAAADVVIGRAGATSISECTALGKPMVLVPLPTAKDGHQLQNALYLNRAGAALVYDQDHLDADTWRVIIETVLLNDWNRYGMADASSRLGRPEAANEVARELVRVMGSSLLQEERTRHWLTSRRLPTLRAARELVASALAAMPEHPMGHPPDLAWQLELDDGSQRQAA